MADDTALAARRSSVDTGQYMRSPNAAVEAEVWRLVASMADETLRLTRLYDDTGDLDVLKEIREQHQEFSDAVLHGLHVRFCINSDPTDSSITRKVTRGELDDHEERVTELLWQHSCPFCREPRTSAPAVVS